MNFYCMTLFPEMIENAFSTSITGRACKNNLLSMEAINIRDYAGNKHNRVDDYPYGGSAGMLMQAEPVYRCYQAVLRKIMHSDAPGDENIDVSGAPDAENNDISLVKKKVRVIYTTPIGEVFTQKKAEELSKEENLIFLCGHYEGIDERVIEEIVTDYISIGDYVLTGGELPALVMMDSIARLVPGVLNNTVSARYESHSDGLLEYPQYTRPEIWRDKKVPEILLSGHHKKIAEWYKEQAIERTRKFRPDMYEAWVKNNPEDK
ncbi:MAG: tRNA (guanosine(37)-N1)-methyltransferase TrmD [Lachnospiraceae bacterium]|nr:tRNA (guanosine(37)-N1)-methyltransferase TrmD [Lachnospiraceae bacterium]